MNKILIIIPTYNEKDNVERIIHAVFKSVPEAHILIVDDSSPDGTGTIIKKLIGKYKKQLHLMTRLKKEGLGKAYVAGFKWALKGDYQYIVSMDADFSHAPKYLPKMLEKAKDNDIVIGSRYVPGGGIVGWDWKRQLNSRGANLVTRMMLGLKPKDSTAGYKVYKRSYIESLPLDKLVASGYAFQVEMLYFAKERQKQVAEVSIIFVDRRVGESKIAGELRKSMKIVWRLFLRRKIVSQALKFMGVGLLNTSVDGGILWFLVDICNIDEITARIVSSSIALISSYILNRIWTFRSHSRDVAGQFTRFVLINGSGLVWNNLLYGFMVKEMHIYYLLAMIIATGIVFFWNFGLSKVWAFRDK